MIEDIKTKLIKANNAYREGNPFLTDVEYDTLEEKLYTLDPNNEWFNKGVNDEIPKNRKMKLPYPMMSLNKVKIIDSIKEWISKYPNASFIVTPKFDGLSVGLHNNIAWTRGDGTIGQDCTKHVMVFNTLIKNLKDFVIRGEIILDNQNWDKFKEINPEASSPRNSATGLINGDFDANRVEEYKLLKIIPYEIINSDLSKKEQLDILNNTLYEHIVDANLLNEEYLLKLFLKWKENYPIDGIVIDVNEKEYRNGTEANGNPSYSIAYKSPEFSDTATGIIKEIELNVNRHGIITPVAILEKPIFLSGAYINRVSAINMAYVHTWGIVPGEKVGIVRSGEVIPKIINVGNIQIPFKETYNNINDYLIDYNNNAEKRQNNMKFNNIIIPDNLKKCPCCGTTLIEKEDEKKHWCDMYCPNKNCYGRKIETTIKFFTICQINGFGDKKIKQITEPFINEHTPIFFHVLNITKNELLNYEGWAETSAQAFINECDKIKNNLPFARFLHATGWFGELGEKTLQKIIDSDGWNMTLEELSHIEGIQSKTANTFINGRMIYDLYEKYIENFFKFDYIKTTDVIKEGKLSNLNVCMTGFRDKILSTQITELGGNVIDTITKNVNCVITKDKNSNSSKIIKAKKMNIEILNIQEFKEKYII